MGTTLAIRVYARWVGLYPGVFRRKHATEMLADFSAEWRRLEARGAVTRLLYGLSVARDGFLTLVTEWFDAIPLPMRFSLLGVAVVLGLYVPLHQWVSVGVDGALFVAIAVGYRLLYGWRTIGRRKALVVAFLTALGLSCTLAMLLHSFQDAPLSGEAEFGRSMGVIACFFVVMVQRRDLGKALPRLAGYKSRKKWGRKALYSSSRIGFYLGLAAVQVAPLLTLFLLDDVVSKVRHYRGFFMEWSLLDFVVVAFYAIGRGRYPPPEPAGERGSRPRPLVG